MALLDCRDTRISLWQGAETVHSPGFVLFDGGEYRFGQAAREQSRLRPRDSNSRFWWQLSTQPLKPALGAARHTADLVHSHLRDIHQRAGAPEKLTLAVPDSMPREQLSLLLGVAQACDFAVSGLVSRSVLLGSVAATPKDVSRVLHLETQLNQTIINELQIADGVLSLVRSTPLPACGLLALLERCVSAIASAFIQQTRYDPRRSAESEQTLYNKLPSILADIDARGEVSVDIDGHRCRVTATSLEGISERLREGIAQTRNGAGEAIIVDPELASLPGLQSLREEAITLDDDALWRAWRHHGEVLSQGGDDIHLIDHLPVMEPPTQAAPPAGGSALNGSETAAREETPTPASNQAPPSAQVQAPSHEALSSEPAVATHVLLGTRALALRGQEIDLGSGFMLQLANDHWTLHGDGALINGLPSTPAQPLHLGDTLSLGAAGHGRLIEVLD